MKRKRVAVLLLSVVALAAAGVSLVSTGRVSRGNEASNVLTLYGNVDVRQVELGFRVPGRLQSMQLEEGEPVTAGALMAKLDARALEDQLRALQAQVEVQEAAVRKLVAGSRPAEIERARAEVEEATAVQQNAQAELKRAQQLMAQDAITREHYDSTAAASRAADARLAAARESLRLLVQGSREEDIAAARAMLDVARANVAAAKTSLDDTRLMAPSDGIVISRVREPGAIVAPNDIVYVVSLTNSVWVRAYVSEVQLGRLHPGMRVEVLSDAAPARPFAGRVGFISPTAEFTPKTVETPELRTELVYRVRIIVDLAPPALRQGMPVTVRIDTTSEQDASGATASGA